MESTTSLLTLALESGAAAYFERLRRRYYPPERNRVPAHVMLFHRLPFDRETASRDLREAVAGTPPFDIGVTEPRSIGSGVAFYLESPELLRVRAALARKWHDDLIAQDRERYRPHVVVTNKVSPAAALATLESLRAAYARFTIEARGLVLWTYAGGTWEDPATFAFEASAVSG